MLQQTYTKFIPTSRNNLTLQHNIDAVYVTCQQQTDLEY